jgi:hypothetical protein
MPKQFSYAKQRNTPCNINAQRWYMMKSINGVKTEKNPILWYKNYKIANYYLNGHANVINN